MNENQLAILLVDFLLFRPEQGVKKLIQWRSIVKKRKEQEEMKREFLEGLKIEGLNKETIDKIMAEHGKSVQALNSEKATLKAENEELTRQLGDRDKDIESLKVSADNDEIKQKYEELQNKYNEDKNNYEKQLAKTKLDSAIDLALINKKAKNNIAVKALLKFDDLKITDDGVVGLEEQLTKVITDNPFLFDSEQTGQKPSFSKEGNPNRTDLTREEVLKNALGIK